MEAKQVKEHYRENKKEIKERIAEFKDLRNADDERIFQELVYVILTSQSDAEKAWEAAKKLRKRDLLLEGSIDEIAEVLQESGIRYEDEKARYIVENRKALSQPTLEDPGSGLKIADKIEGNPEKVRKWLAENIKGISWKGSSHFLRNIGRGKDFAIISSHIIGKMHELGLLQEAEMPSGRKDYLKYESKLKRFSEKIDVPLEELDLVLWSMETDEVFK